MTENKTTPFQYLLGWALLPIHHSIFVFLFLIFHPIQIIAYRISPRMQEEAVRLFNWTVLWNLKILGGTIFKNISDQIPENRPIIFVSNHQSMYDIPLYFCYLAKFRPRFISKKELAKWIPSVSYNLRVGRDAVIDRSDRTQAVEAIKNLAIEIQKENHSVVIFAEGTRARDGKLKPFKVGGIATLLKHAPSAVIVPAAIENSWLLLLHKMFPIPFGNNIQFTVFDPIEPNGEDPGEIVKKTENIIRQKLGQLHNTGGH